MKIHSLIFFALLALLSCGKNERNAPATDAPMDMTTSTQALPPESEYQRTEAAELKLEEDITEGDDKQEDELPKDEKGNFKKVKGTQKVAEDTINIEAQIIKTANINIQVKEFKEGTEKIKQVIKANNGYISSSDEQNNGYTIQGEIVVRILSKNFDKTIKELLAIAIYVNSKSENAENVTEEFVDIMMRLRTKKQVEKRYLEILGQAKSIKDILEVEEKLRVIREEIEAKEGRLKYLKDQVRFSTINLSYYQTNEKYQKAPEPSFFSKIGDALVEGWQGLLVFLVGLAYLWPLWILCVVLIWWLRKTWQKKKIAKKQQDSI